MVLIRNHHYRKQLATPRVPPVLTGFDRVTIAVRDLDVAMRFYVHVLGGERVRRSRAVEISFGARPFLELSLAEEPIARPPAQLAFTVRPEDLLRARDDLRVRGIPSYGPWRHGNAGHVALDFLDPFGNPLELVTLGYRGEAIEESPNRMGLAYAWTSVDLSPAIATGTPTPKDARPRRYRAPRLSSRRLIQ
jgi:catechol 2,3-dioxygenase-like lactoylglutathione lyase family enzyme